MGGISRYYYSLFCYLKKNNINFEVIPPIYKNVYLKYLDKKFKKGIYFSRYPIHGIINKLNNFFYNSIINSAEFDIFHDTYYSSPPNSIRNKKKIITVYDLIYEKFYEKIKFQNTISYRKKIFEKMDHFICISENTKNDLIELYNIDEKKIDVIYLGSDHLTNDLLKISKNNSYFETINFKKPFILYVGSRNRYKNFKHLLDQISKSKKIQNDFNIVLFGGGKITIEEKKIINNLGMQLNNFIQLEGDDNFLSYLYNNARLFIFPSIYEGFGLPLLESMNANCPVICSNSKTFVELGRDSVEYFELEKKDSLIDKLNFLLYSDHRINELKSLGKIRARDFSWEKCSHQTISIYNKLK